MVIVDALLVIAMLFFLFLPITDLKTVQMKLCVLCALAAALDPGLRAAGFGLSMISAQTPCVCREGKPVSTPHHVRGMLFRIMLSPSLCARASI